MKLALYQMRMSADEAENLERGLAALRTAAANGADLIVYPELQLHRFFPQYEGRDTADKLLTPDHPIVRQFQEACRQHHIMAAPNFYLQEPSGRSATSSRLARESSSPDSASTSLLSRRYVSPVVRLR